MRRTGADSVIGESGVFLVPGAAAPGVERVVDGGGTGGGSGAGGQVRTGPVG